MTLTVYYDEDGDQILKVNEEIRSYSTACDIRNLMQAAYDAGIKKEGFIADIQFKNTCLNTQNMK